ncbi:uncharacterized protein LOC125715441 isoform X2 [Brienomyrus brachyistius]|uniref:uncharacterized protein LOC125715441 isoform X2 n=1 Tax=Brienomyrus brachyistius TaxID=42636 RepID=UPI0020B3B8D4|nr:uncharacterized protein LOC125715441 isoform X2 [Brienomyrus brachyistius]
MHYGADMCLPRKKKVIQSFRSNTHRIFDEKVPDRLDANKIYNHHTYQRRTSEEINQLKTHNIPHPRNAKYIRSNVRFLNEPMAYIDVQQFNGWAKEAELNVKSTAPYSRNSTQRSDFQACPGTLAACTRYGMNPNKYPASGIVPTVSPTSTQKPLLEKICFIHQFDSRKPQDQAYEGKYSVGLAGGMACKVLPPSTGVHLVLHPFLRRPPAVPGTFPSASPAPLPSAPPKAQLAP